VTAIVLDHEQADKKARSGNGQQQVKSIPDAKRETRQQPKENEGSNRNQNFDDAAPVVWLAIPRQAMGQGAYVDLCVVRAGFRSFAQNDFPFRQRV
jgi:hypothetical protein